MHVTDVDSWPFTIKNADRTSLTRAARGDQSSFNENGPRQTVGLSQKAIHSMGTSCHLNDKQDAQLSQKERAAGCVSFGQNRRRE